MALWGNNDNVTSRGTVTVNYDTKVVEGNSGGSGTQFGAAGSAQVGDVIRFTKSGVYYGDAVITGITSARILSIGSTAGLSGAAISASDFTISQLPKYTILDRTYSETRTDADVRVYGVDADNNALLLAKRDKDGNQVDSILYNNIDVNADPKQKIRIRTSAGVSSGKDGMIGYVTAKATRTNHYELTFDNPAIPLAALQASDLVIDVVTEETEHGDILAYDSNTEMWETTAGGFVQKIGDEMSGKLDIKMSNLNDVGLKVLGGLRIKRENDLNGKNALTVNHNNIVFEATTTFKRPDGQNDVANFTIQGKRPGSSTVTENLFTVYRAPGTEGDAVNYYGRIENRQKIINKGHLDETINFQQYPELT